MVTASQSSYDEARDHHPPLRARTRPQVLVAHPGRQHSHQLALALAEADMLSGYLTGVPTHQGAVPALLRPLMRRYLASYAVDLDPRKVTHNFTFPVVRGLASRLCGREGAARWTMRGSAMFDRYVSRRIARIRPNIVVCYERAALAVFRVARRLGIPTVLDAASFHHGWQDRFYDPPESPATHQHIVARKNAEIALADYVLTVSEFARESYIAAGIPKDRVHAIPMGVNVGQFSMPNGARQQSDLLRFVFVGHVERRKGADVLRDAVARLQESSVPFELSLIGNDRSNLGFNRLPNVKALGWMSQSELAAQLTRQDVLILPSRHDSFGMVVAEAMACGLPVIVSDHVGAKEMITPQRNGLIVPAGDSHRLAEAMEWFVAHRGDMSTFSASARAAAERYDWSVYRNRAVTFFQNILS